MKKGGAHNWNRVYSILKLPSGDKVLTRNQDYGAVYESAIAVPMEEFFSILREGHLATGHGK